MTTDPDDFPSFGLSNEWLIAIGAIVVQWAAFEQTLTGHLRTLIGQPEASGERPNNLRMGAGKRLALFAKLAPLIYTGTALENAKRGLLLANSVKDTREWIAHGTGLTVQSDTLSVMKSDEMRTNQRVGRYRDFTREELVNAAQTMEEARMCLQRAYGAALKTFSRLPWLDTAEGKSRTE